jgi:hypothetical protein
MQLTHKEYLIKFRFVINYKGSKRSESFYQYYLPRWGNFLKKCMQIKLPKYLVLDLPRLRKVVPKNLTVEEISDLLVSKNAMLARSLIDTAPLFNSSPKDLKVHILATFNISSDDYLNYR